MPEIEIMAQKILMMTLPKLKEMYKLINNKMEPIRLIR
jgi:hypothetical protein